MQSKLNILLSKNAFFEFQKLRYGHSNFKAETWYLLLIFCLKSEYLFLNDIILYCEQSTLAKKMKGDLRG